MAGTVTPNMTVISLCNETTGWTSLGGTLALNDTSLFDSIEGANCCQVYAAGGGDRGAQWDFGAGTEVDFSTATNNCIVFWFAFSKKSYGANPLRIRMTDTAGAWSEWEMFTAASLPHPSWIPWLLKPTATPTTTSGTLTLSAVRTVSWRVTAGAGKTFFYWDAVRYGTGLTITAGTGGAPAIFEDFATAEATNAYGIVNKYKGIYYVQGQLNIGTTAATATYFKDTGKTVVFMDSKVSAGFYRIKAFGNTTLDTEIYFGDKSGTSGITGCNFQRESPTQVGDYLFDVSASDKTKIGIYGTNIRRAYSILLPPYNASYLREVLNSNFVSCGQLVANSCPITNCNFISTASTLGALLWNESITITKCNFIGNTIGAAIQMPSAAGTPYAYNALFFSVNTFDVNNTATALTINKNQLSDPTSYTGSLVTFAGTSVTTQIIVTDIDTSAVIVGARVLILVSNGVNFPYQASVTIVSSGTTATVTHTGHGLASNDNVLISGAVPDAYNGAFTITYIGVDSYSYTMQDSASSPATGTITATMALINIDTNSSGIASDTRSMASNQPITGKVRLATGSYYKQAPISDTVDKDYGKSINVQLIPDL